MSDSEQVSELVNVQDVKDAENPDPEEEGENLADSEEEEEETDEETAKKIADGFIVDDDEAEEEEEEEEGRAHHVHRKKKRKRDRIESDLDDEDLDLLEENTGINIPRNENNTFKRIKRGRGREESPRKNDVSRIFDEDDAIDEQVRDDLSDFVVDDYEDGDIVAEEQSAGYRKPANETSIYADPENEERVGLWYEVFGDDSEYGWAMQGNDSTGQETANLKNVFEPSELQERMLTDDDETIRKKDLPERMQVRYGINPIRRLTNSEIEEETQFVQKSFTNPWIQNQQELTESITSVLKLFGQEFVEAPYIFANCQDHIASFDLQQFVTTEILTLDDLWSIYDLDLKFRAFLEYREGLRNNLDKNNIHDTYVDQLISQAEVIEELRDIDDYVKLVYADSIQSKNERSVPKRRSEYDLLKKGGAHAFAKQFGIDTQAFAKSLHFGNKMHYPNDLNRHVDEAAEDFLRATDDTVSDENISQKRKRLIEDSKLVLAFEIASDPYVKKATRKWFLEHAEIIVKPTEKGYNRIDKEHQYHSFKFLKKPIQRFEDTGQFLQILKSEREGLTRISVSLDDQETFLRHFSVYLISDSVSEFGHSWNSQREEIARISLEKYLYESMDRWLRGKLQSEGEEWIAIQCYKSLEKKVDMLPFGTNSMENGATPQVLAISSGNGDRDDLIESVFLDEHGTLKDHSEFKDLRDNEEDREAFFALLGKRKPDIIAISGYNFNTRRLYDQIREVIKENSRLTQEDIYVTVVNDEVAHLAKKSKRYQDEFSGRGFSELKFYCISLARLLQSPVNEYAALGRNLLNIRHHPLQELVPPEMLLMHLERAIVNVINENGVDITEALDEPYKAITLQYVSGLGPRKAQAIINKMRSLFEKENTEIHSREEMKGTIVGDKVFQNCACFIRFGPDSIDPLDRTRIHPQEYELARKMAADALDLQDEDVLDDNRQGSYCVLEAMKHPKKLNDLILEEYAEQLQAIFSTPRKITLYHIKKELSSPYKDQRKDFPKPTVDDTFELITKETSDVLAPDLIIPVEVYRVEDRFAKARLNSGLDSIIGINNISDETVTDARDILHKGAVLDCAVVRIDKLKFQVELSCRPSVLQRCRELNENREVEKDSCFDEEALNSYQNQHVPKRQVIPVLTRVINHPLFAKMTYKEAEIYLEPRHSGELVIRPSSQGYDHIAVTWKVTEGLYQHLDVHEIKTHEKVPKSKFQVGNYEYQDLDELIVSHIEASARKVEELTNHPKFRNGPDELSHYFETEFQINPQRSVYGFCINRERPGIFDLAYRLNPKQPVKNWHVKVTPDGYKLYDTEYPDIPSLVNGFKRLQLNRRKAR